MKGKLILAILLFNLIEATAQDPYRAHMDAYTWGSNAIKCAQGNMYYDLLSFAIDSTKLTDAIDASQAYIHYIHGVNPLNIVYLSNMYKFGGDNCVNEFYHTWFCNGSPKWDRVGKSVCLHQRVCIFLYLRIVTNSNM